MPPVVKKIEAVPCCELGEGPHWDDKSQSLYFVDIFMKSINIYTPKTNTHKKVCFDQFISFIIPVEGTKNDFVISKGREIHVVSWDGQNKDVLQTEKLCEVDDELGFRDNRLNDAKADPSGRLWAGTMGIEPIYGHVEPNKGSLYSIQNREVKKHVSSVSISNGLAFDVSLKKCYYIDSPARNVVQYDFDIKQGIISNPVTIFSLDKHNIPGVPDGQAIDTDGNLWVAIFNGYRVIKIDPRIPETLLEDIPIPAKQVTSVAFGGPNLDELYVTSASFTIDGVELKEPIHGALYKITDIGAKGFPGDRVKI